MATEAQRSLQLVGQRQFVSLRLAWSPGPRLCLEWELEVPAGCTLLQALQGLAQGRASARLLVPLPPAPGLDGCAASLVADAATGEAAAAAARTDTAAAASDWRTWVRACEQGQIGIWGRLAAPDTRLHDGDRIERYRPLRVDPKVARRERYRQHLARQQVQRKP